MILHTQSHFIVFVTNFFLITAFYFWRKILEASLSFELFSLGKEKKKMKV